MSMFHELMMRKKEQIMYATIKGTLTENDGVFSGFSISNYLKTQTEFAPNNSTFEMLWKVKTPSSYNSHRNWIIANPENSSDYKGIAFGCNTNGDLSLYLSSTGTSWNITASGNIVNLTTDTDYWLKLKYDLSKYVVLVSTDGTNYTQVLSVSSSEKIFASSHIIGTNGYVFGQIWGGSIDLNNSYIKIGSTKYKLQAVVGYTVVGSPTITDGVVSGFTSNSPYAYLQTASNFPLQPNSFEMVFKLKYDTSYSGERYFAGGENRTSFILGVTYVSSNSFRFKMYAGNSTGTDVGWSKQSEDVALNENDWIFVKYMFDGQEYSMWVSENGITYTKIVSYSSSTLLYGNAPIRIGLWTLNNEGVCFKGEIDMNETYIKINNKLWFNGQQA